MSLQDSTFNTAHVLDNEIVKANDFEFAFEKIAENVSRATQMILESNQDFVINGKVLPYQGMNVKVSPIYGVCKSTGVPFGRTEEAIMEYGFEESTSGRVDIIEVRGEWETYDNQQRAFNDPDTNVQTYQYVDTKKLMRPTYRIKKGVEGSAVAPEVDDGYVKLAEVVIRANNSVIDEEDIKNITADIAGVANADWTTEPDITYNIGYISDVNERFRIQHNEDGTHKDNVIDTDSLNIGTGAKQVNGNVLPIGNTVTIPEQTTSSSDTIFATISKVVTVVTSLYNTYLKYGNYGFKGELSVSDIVDANDTLVKPITIKAAGDGSAVIKIDGNAVLSIDANGKLSTNGYTATANNNLVTKAVTDAISNSLNTLAGRVTAVEQTLASNNEYVNNVLSTGTNGRFNVDSTAIVAATTANIVLSGSQTIDGVNPQNGDFILVKNQTDAKENGIYQYASSSTWSRISTIASPNDIKAKIFSVNGGTINGGKLYYVAKVDFEDPTAFGTDTIPFSEYMGALKPVANKLIMRDANGRAKVAAPSASDDIARKAEVDALYSTTVKGTALGTAAVGTCTTFARSDHVHPSIDVYCGTTCKCGIGSTALCLGSNAFNSTAFTTCTGTVTSVCIKCGTSGAAGSITTSGTITLAANAFNQYATISTTTYPGACCTGTSNYAVTTMVCCSKQVTRTGYTAAYDFHVLLTNGSTTANGTDPYVSNSCCLRYCNTTGNLRITNSSGTTVGTICASCFMGTADKASKDGSGCAFGTAARYNYGAFLPANGCAADSAKLGGTAAANYVKICTGSFGTATWWANPTTHQGGVYMPTPVTSACLWEVLKCAINCSTGCCYIINATSSVKSQLSTTGMFYANKEPQGVFWDNGGCIAIHDNTNAVWAFHRNDGTLSSTYPTRINW